MALEEFALPDGEEADYLLAGLARLIALRGAETFLAAPIVLQETKFFPDRLEARAQGVSVLLRRLLAYAELEPRRLDVEIFAQGRTPAVTITSHQGGNVLAWFLDISQGVYRFGVRDSELNDVRSLVGTLGHEVAHAYRAHHELQVRDRGVEEQLTDLTTVYLGFGALTLESSYQFKTGHHDADGKKLLYERRGGGYLRPGQLAFLLAAQLVARGKDRKLLKSLSSTLSPNQFAAVTAAWERLAEEPLALSQTLGLPGAQEWPKPRSLEQALAPLPEARVQLFDAPTEQREQQKRERVAFRVAGNRWAVGFGLGAGGGFLLALWLDLDLAFWPLTIGLTILGWFVGRAISAPRCSACERGVRAHSAHCASCEAPLVADIDHIDDRLDAEERYAIATRVAHPVMAAGVRCPRCAWAPRIDDQWQCSCGARWNTFTTRGQCPQCRKQWSETACLGCKQRSPHAAWYPSAADA